MPAKDYHTELLKQLKDSEEAAEYLNACYQDSEEVFLAGLRNVVEARGGVRSISKLSELNRENLYRILSKKGNPRLSSLTSVLEAVGLSIRFSVRKKREIAA